MDEDTISLLKTVCVAGRARGGFNDNSNQRLDQLVSDGLLDAVNAPAADPKKGEFPRRIYRPTEKGRAMVRSLEVA